MKNVAENLQANEAIQEVGKVIAIDGRSLTVRTASGDYAARRAVSCLVDPALDDLVLLSTAGNGRSWLLAVLERDDGSVVLSAEGDMTLRQKRGRVAIAAQDGVSIASGKDVSVVSGSVDINAVDGNVVFQKLSYLGRVVRSEVEKVKTIASTFDSVLERFSQRVKRSYRVVEEIDQTRAERIDMTAKKNMSLRGHNTLMTAEQLVKVDGEQIHLG